MLVLAPWTLGPVRVGMRGARCLRVSCSFNELLINYFSPLLFPGPRGYSGSIPCRIYGTALTTPPL